MSKPMRIKPLGVLCALVVVGLGAGCGKSPDEGAATSVKVAFWGSPEEKAIIRPSGDQEGLLSLYGDLVS